MYIDKIQKQGNAVAGSEDISAEKALSEYIMLELRSSGIDINNLKKRFGSESSEWLKKNYSYFELLKSKNFVLLDNGFIKLTSKGYAVCDEILSEIL